jgi:hypothetical protein
VFLNNIEYVFTLLFEVPAIDDVVSVFSLSFGVVVIPGVCVCLRVSIAPVETTKWR